MIDGGYLARDPAYCPDELNERRFENVARKYWPNKDPADVLADFVDLMRKVTDQLGLYPTADRWRGLYAMWRALELSAAGDERWRDHYAALVYDGRSNLLTILGGLANEKD